MPPRPAPPAAQKAGSPPAGAAPRLHLRILETTDVHGNLLPFDYYANRPVTEYGLARTATLIRQARAERRNCLLFDNGDFLQGTPVSDLTARPGRGWDGPHPVIQAMNALDYDAVAPGNHEFNFGLDWLEEVLAQARFPVTCANLLRAGNGAKPEPLFPPWLLLRRRMQDEAGQAHDLAIGVIGLVPPQITTWDRFHLQGRLNSRDIVETARELVPRLRAAGADLVIALAHTGLDTGPDRPMMENAALPLAAVPGIDAVLAGHSHQVFSAAAGPGTDGRDTAPIVMAGSRGSHLGVLDLVLARAGDGWAVTTRRSETRPVAPASAAPAPADPGLCRLLTPAHERTLELTKRPLGRTARPLHSYLALAGNCAATQVVTRAQRLAVQALLENTSDSGIPVLSASAPFRTGGRGGPHHYTDIPPGEICLRHAADLYSFPNLLCALRMSGAQIRDWLERAACVFHTIRPGQDGQMLCNPAAPGHIFDVIDGLTYQIDLGQPALYDPVGRRLENGAGRIGNLACGGVPVADADRFILATNNYRAFGGGPYPGAGTAQIARAGMRMIRDIVAESILSCGTPDQAPAEIWRFRPMPGTTVIYETGPGLRRYPQEIESAGLRDLGDGENGFARFALAL